MSVLAPEIQSELASRLLALEPGTRRLFALDEITLSGQQIEELMRGAFLAGYGSAIGEIATGPGPYPPLPPLARLMEENAE